MSTIHQPDGQRNQEDELSRNIETPTLPLPVMNTLLWPSVHTCCQNHSRLDCSFFSWLLEAALPRCTHDFEGAAGTQKDIFKLFAVELWLIWCSLSSLQVKAQGLILDHSARLRYIGNRRMH
ncbi:hypothetical protein BDV23DRAFT_146008 [Aspergillus alliaceus]|uniref:Uncharacterized protein n=1 Tax=Petromyces alliaceus TaxID=209559 RepID=A0A5N7CLB1_PETAA|nr:hypothetical protein BDV23DRAFT_146008 [Aspergillus alliaceus]